MSVSRRCQREFFGGRTAVFVHLRGVLTASLPGHLSLVSRASVVVFVVVVVVFVVAVVVPIVLLVLVLLLLFFRFCRLPLLSLLYLPHNVYHSGIHSLVVFLRCNESSVAKVETRALNTLKCN